MFHITSASAQGSRDHQEDRLMAVCIECPNPAWNGCLLSAFDGHRDASTAEAAARSAVSAFRTALEQTDGEPLAALEYWFKLLVHQTKDMDAGATASAIFLPDHGRRAYAGVLGDSPIVIADHRGKSVIGPNHNVRTNLRERKAAEERGGIYADGYLEDAKSPGVGLQMARALGDRDLAQVLSREPEMLEVDLGPNSFGLVGTDGLFDSIAGQSQEAQLERLMGLIARGADAKAVVEDALQRETGDNVSAIVWRPAKG